jgi:hypothetical protein
MVVVDGRRRHGWGGGWGSCGVARIRLPLRDEQSATSDTIRKPQPEKELLCDFDDVE